MCSRCALQLLSVGPVSLRPSTKSDNVLILFDQSAVVEGAAESVVRFPQLEQFRAVVNISFPHAALQEFITALPELKS